MGKRGEVVTHFFRRFRRSERGAGLLTGLILLPILLAFAELIVLGGRVASAQSDLNAASREAARQATVSAGQSSASMIIGPITETALANRGPSCIDNSATLGGGTIFERGGQVEVIVTCEVDVSDLSLLSLPFPSRVFTATALEPIDPFRVIE